jgi:beta-galactosidase
MSEKSSRRQFLRTAAGGIAASWGSLQIFTGPIGFAAPSASERKKLAQKFFVYGAHFYRPPDPPASERRRMLKEIAEKYQFNTIRIWTPWAYQNPAPNRFEFGELEELMGYCDKFGLKVLMGAMIEDAPYWLEEAHPETRYINANNRAYRLGGAGNDVAAGRPGLCLDWQPVREAAAKYLREMARIVSAHPSMHAYDCWNEPHNEPTGHRLVGGPIDIGESIYCYCHRTLAEFRSWLQKRYSTLERLNVAWVRNYPSWSMVNPPRKPGTYSDWLDWLRFIIERNTAELRFRVEQLQAVDSRSLLECHIGLQVAVDSPTAILGVNPWRLAELVETWGLSYFPGFIPGPISWATARLELTRCQAGEKPFWLTELQGGYAGGSLLRMRRMRPRDIRLWNWMAVATGAKGLIYWTYSPATTAWESGGFGLVAPDGSPTERVLEAVDDRGLIQAHWDLIEHYKPKPEVAILVDQDSALLTFAINGNEDLSAQSFRGYYKAFWACDFFVDFIEPQSVSANPYKVIVAPWHLMARSETCEQLRRFVESGGTLILETAFGMHDERASFNPVIPPYGLAEAFGYREGESFYIPNDDLRHSMPEVSSGKADERPASERIYLEKADLSFSNPIAATVKAHTFVTPLSVSTATIIAKYESMPVAIRKKLGRGQVYYIGTNLGASIEAGDQGGIDLIRAILAGVVRPAATAEKVRPRLIEGTGRSLLVVVNEGAEDQLSKIKLPSRYLRATDLYSNEQQSVQENSISVTVPFEGVSVLLLE